MEPLSQKKRNRLLIFFVAIFASILPFLILYALGFRFSNSSLIKTGGLYIHRPTTEVVILLDEKPLDSKLTSFLQRYYFVQSLKPREYTIRTELVDYHSWEKTILIESQKTTEVSPFLVAINPEKTLVPKYLTTETDIDQAVDELSSASNLLNNSGVEESKVKNPLYEKVVALFEESEKDWAKEYKDYRISFAKYEDLLEETHEQNTATTTGEAIVTTEDILAIGEPRLHIKKQQKIEVWQTNNGKTILSALEKNSSNTAFYCDDAPTCQIPKEITEISAYSHFDFFPERSDVLIITKEDGLFVVELDGRGKRNIFPLFQGQNISFVIDDKDTLYVYDQENYYLLEI